MQCAKSAGIHALSHPCTPHVRTIRTCGDSRPAPVRVTACLQTPAIPGHTRQELHWPQSSGGAGPTMRARAGAEAQTSLHAAGSHLAERGGLDGARDGTRGRAELQSCGCHEGGSCGQAHGGDEQGAERSHARIAEMGKRRNGLAFFAEFLKKEQKNLTLQTLSLTEPRSG